MINNALSFALIMVFWIMAHQNRASGGVFGFSVSLGCSLLAVGAAGNMVFRNVEGFLGWLPYSLLLTKFCLLVTLGLMAYRFAFGPRRR